MKTKTTQPATEETARQQLETIMPIIAQLKAAGKVQFVGSISTDSLYNQKEKFALHQIAFIRVIFQSVLTAKAELMNSIAGRRN